MTPHRIGLVVPSSNVTVGTEVPALLARHAATAGAYSLLRHLGLPAILPGAGHLLATGRSARSGPLTGAQATGSPLQSPS